MVITTDHKSAQDCCDGGEWLRFLVIKKLLVFKMIFFFFAIN